MKHFTIILVLVFAAQILTAQNYEKQLGLRLGVTSGLSAKVIKNDRTAIEGLFGFRDGGVQIYVLLESYHLLSRTNKTKWMMYFGGGGHVGYVDGYNRVRRWSNTAGYYYDEQQIVGAVIGLDAVVGTDLSLVKVPLTFSFEFKPLVELVSFQQFIPNFWDVGFSIKYNF